MSYCKSFGQNTELQHPLFSVETMNGTVTFYFHSCSLGNYPKRNADMIRRFINGENTIDIALDYNCCANTIREICKRFWFKSTQQRYHAFKLRYMRENKKWLLKCIDYHLAVIGTDVPRYIDTLQSQTPRLKTVLRNFLIRL